MLIFFNFDFYECYILLEAYTVCDIFLIDINIP